MTLFLQLKKTGAGGGGEVTSAHIFEAMLRRLWKIFTAIRSKFDDKLCRMYNEVHLQPEQNKNGMS